MIHRLDVHAGKIVLRAALLIPLSLVLAGLLLGEGAEPFAAFGSFVLLTMVTFVGRPLSRTFAWLVFALFGCLLVVIGTAASTVPAVAVAAIVSFRIFFSGVVNPYVSAVKTGAILLLALPLMVPGEPSEIGLRVAGWLLACAVCIPATYLVWRLPWISDLRAQAGKACGKLVELVLDPSDSGRVGAAGRAVWSLGHRFTDTANRPTGSAGASASLAGSIDRVTDWYGPAGRLSIEGEDIPQPLALEDTPKGLFSGDAGEPDGATLGRFWIGENFEYLAELSGRYVERSHALRGDHGATG